MMHPDLEVVDVRRDESFKVWSHGYPYRTIRWHFHPEFELHLIVATRGKYFVGDRSSPAISCCSARTCRTTGSATWPKAKPSSAAIW